MNTKLNMTNGYDILNQNELKTIIGGYGDDPMYGRFGNCPGAKTRFLDDDNASPYNDAWFTAFGQALMRTLLHG